MEIATDERSRALVSVPAAIGATSDADRHIATAALPIGALPPGDFVVRAIVNTAGQVSGMVTQTLRKASR